MPTLSVLVPAYNEQDTIQSVVSDCYQTLTKCKEIGYLKKFEIIVLDDGSTDKTFEIASKLVNAEIHLYRSSKPSGLQEAYKKLLQYASFEWTAVIPGDAQWPASGLLKMTEISSQNDWEKMVIGVRTNKSHVYGVFRLVISIMFRLFSFLSLGEDIKDPGSIKLIPRKVAIEADFCKGPLNEVEKVLIGKRKYFYKILKVEVVWRARQYGNSTGVSRKNLTLSIYEMPKLLSRSLYFLIK